MKSTIASRLKSSRVSLFEKALANIVLSYSYGWWRNVLTVIKKFGLPYDRDENFLKDARDFGVREARGLVNLNIVKGRGDKAVIKALKYSHWALLENVEVEPSKSFIRFRVINCTARRALEKWKLANYSCRNFTLNALEGFVQTLEPKARVECVFCPPQPGRGDISCEWLIFLG